MTSNPSGEAGRTAAKWTPGPWKVRDGAHRRYAVALRICNEQLENIATVWWTHEANARLISKAPELAAILQEIVELVRAEAQVDNGEGLKFLNASAQLVEAERILREAGALEESR